MKFLIKTLGCKVNQVEGAYIIEQLKKAGYTLAEKEDTAQILILNSCAVTEKAYKEALKILRNWSKLNPRIAIITGCSAQVYGENLRDYAQSLKIPHFIILGHNQKFNLEEYLNNLETPLQMDVSFTLDKPGPLLLEEFYGHSRAFVKIQDGCSSYCSYCIVPYARGPSRSLKEEDILKQIELFIHQGYEEIVLTGIHLGMWGADLDPPKNLVYLLDKIEKLLQKANKSLNLRLSSLEINEIDQEFIDFAKKSPFLCEHFHLPLQSGSNSILKKMNRKYTAQEYLDKLYQLADLFPKATLGADVIVGFPGEGEKEFRETYDLIEKSPLNWLHIFPFSPRPGTPAEKMEPKIKPSEIKERVNLLKHLHQKKRKLFLEKNLMEIRRVIIEEENHLHFKGLTDNYIQVLIGKETGVEFQKGKLVHARLLNLWGDLVLAEPLKEKEIVKSRSYGEKQGKF